MKKSVRKWLATALSLCLLAAMLPLSALGVNAGLSVFRVNFDDGNVVFSVNAEDTAVIEDGTLHWTTVAWKNLSKSFNGVVGVEHTLTFRAKAASDATVKYIFLDGSWQNTAAPTYAPTITTEWTTYTYQFTPDYAGMVLILQSEKATDIWLDDISITVETSDGNVPAIPTDAVYGEDFEDGALNGWTSNNSIVSSSAVPVPDAGAGNYSMKFSSTNYSYTNYAFTVLPNTDYVFHFSVLSGTAGYPLNARVYASSTDLVLKKWTPGTTAWESYSLAFNSGNNSTVNLRFQAGWQTGDYYIDNVSVTMIAAEPQVPDNAIYSFGFENGIGNWSASAGTAEVINAAKAPYQKPTNQNKVLKVSVPSDTYPYIVDKTAIAVQPNTDYVVSFDALNTSASNPVQVILAENSWLGGAFATSLDQKIKVSNTAWETYSMVFNSDDRTQLYLGAKSQWANTTVYFDNFYIAPISGTASNDGYIKNGDFEVGDPEWLHTGNNTVIADPTTSGMGNVIQTNEPTSGAHMFSQNARNLVVGHEYTLSFKVYSYSTASNAAFWVSFPSAFTTWSVDAGNAGLTSQSANNYTPRININGKNSTWHTVNITFTAQSTIALIDFKNYREKAGQYYFDDITITKGACVYTAEETKAPTCGETGVMTYTCVCGNSYTEDIPAAGEHVYDSIYDADCNVCGGVREVTLPVTFEGNSISEDVRGLAFLFNMRDIVIGTDGGTVADYTDATIGDYTLVTMGAVVSNQSAEATADRANAGEQGIAGTIDISAANLWEVAAADNTAAFAVRVINIPERHLGTTIYARPYFVIRIGEVEYTIYGAVQSASYSEVADRV